MESSYKPLKSLIEAAGYVAVYDHAGDVERLICASRKNHDGQPCGNSFWVSQHKGLWFLGTWVPRHYRVPPTIAVAKLCIACLSCQDRPITVVPEDILKTHRLEEISAEEYDLMVSNNTYFQPPDLDLRST